MMQEIDYYGLGSQDAQLLKDIEALVIAHNELKIGPRLAYGPYIEDLDDPDDSYWGLHKASDAAELIMFVVYDDETTVMFSAGSAEQTLFEAVLDAMQRCLRRQGYSSSVRKAAL